MECFASLILKMGPPSLVLTSEKAKEIKSNYYFLVKRTDLQNELLIIRVRSLFKNLHLLHEGIETEKGLFLFVATESWLGVVAAKACIHFGDINCPVLFTLRN